MAVQGEKLVIEVKGKEAFRMIENIVFLRPGAKAREKNIVEVVLGSGRSKGSYVLASLCTGVERNKSLNMEFTESVAFKLVIGSGPGEIIGTETCSDDDANKRCLKSKKSWTSLILIPPQPFQAMRQIRDVSKGKEITGESESDSATTSSDDEANKRSIKRKKSLTSLTRIPPQPFQAMRKIRDVSKGKEIIDESESDSTKTSSGDEANKRSLKRKKSLTSLTRIPPQPFQAMRKIRDVSKGKEIIDESESDSTKTSSGDEANKRSLKRKKSLTSLTRIPPQPFQAMRKIRDVSKGKEIIDESESDSTKTSSGDEANKRSLKRKKSLTSLTRIPPQPFQAMRKIRDVSKGKEIIDESESDSTKTSSGDEANKRSLKSKKSLTSLTRIPPQLAQAMRQIRDVLKGKEITDDSDSITTSSDSSFSFMEP
ncbi:hypothetical protein RF11_11775 [Thelohanellus kitauei]|uniref:Nucleoplasmin core domain-containing protein n=1 Tax=Thelohanellus kitauei TaxID=669202 RepID=A0A0C2M8P9_THEKT|nr:hypothetical protein RF11_11775 [Thelohanellus kitauei]